MDKEFFLKNKLAKRLLIIIGTTAVYFFVARLSLMLAIPNSLASPVWPTSGFALAALLLLGYQAWPGIFLGSLLANSWPLSPTFFSFLPFSLSISIGATLQALIETHFLNKIDIKKYIFNSYKHVYLFFLLTFIVYLINPTISVFTLYLGGVVPYSSIGENWLTWWLGDTAGVFIVTPLILAWTSLPFRQQLFERSFEAILLLLSVLLVGFICFGWWSHKNYPLAHLFIPVLLWAVFRFREKGATTTLAIMAAMAILGTAHGYGAFIRPTLPLNESLLLLQLFIGCLIVTALTLTAVLNKLQEANQLLQSYSRDLESQVMERTAQVQDRTLQLQDKTLQLQNRTLELQERTKELQDRTEKLQDQNQTLEQMLVKLQLLQNRVIAQEKLASLGALTIGIARQLRNPLNFVINFTEINQELLNELTNWLEQEKDKMKIEQFTQGTFFLMTLKNNSQKISYHSKNASHILEKMIIHTQSRIGQPEFIDINTLVDESIMLVYYSMQAQDASFQVRVEKDYDSSIEKIKVVPQLVSRTIANILNNAFYSVRQKKEELGEAFTPLISIRTENQTERIAIIIRDNGNGIPSALRNQLFIPFFSTKPDEIGFGLAISKDLIAQLGGEIQVNSVEGEFAEFTILIPKEVKQ